MTTQHPAGDQDPAHHRGAHAVPDDAPEARETPAPAPHGHAHTHAGPDDDVPVFDADFWENRYRSMPRVWSRRPNAHLVTDTAALPPGRALDVGCGEGADALWLAERGWQVLAVDLSPTALVRAAEHAAEQGPEVAGRIVWQEADLTAWTPPAGEFDLVTAHFVHLPAGTREGVLAALADAVAPGGTLLYVGHDVSDLDTTIGRPNVPHMFWAAEDVAAALDPAAWTVEVAEARPRDATDAEGRTVRIHDAVTRARRR